MAIQLAKAVTGARIIAMDIDDNKLQTEKTMVLTLLLTQRMKMLP